MMNITSMLNGPGDKPKRQASTPYTKPPSLPSLDTSQRSDADVLQRTAGQRGQYAVPPHPSQSPASRYQPGALEQHHYIPPGHHSWPEQANAPSPYATPGPISGNTYPFGQQPSLSRTPSSVHSPAPLPYTTGSPISNRSYSQQPPLNIAHHPSQPSTPYGPPISIPRTASHGVRDSPAMYDHHQRTSSGTSMSSHALAVMPSPNGMGHLLNSPGSMSHLLNSPLSVQRQSPVAHKISSISRQPSLAMQNSRERSHSVEVSPKTVSSGLPRRDISSYEPSSHLDGVAGSHMQSYNNSTSTSIPSRTVPLAGNNHQAELSVTSNLFHDASISIGSISASTIMGKPALAHSKTAFTPNANSTPRAAPLLQSSTRTLKRPLDTSLEPDPGNQRRPVKRTRHREPPIWAQRARCTISSKNNADHDQQKNGIRVAQPNDQIPIFPQQPVMQQAIPATLGLSEAWEPVMNDTIPHDEIIRQIAHFLFKNVVSKDAFATSQAGGLPSANGVLEIEAKIGTLIDRSTGTRVHFPIMNEAVLQDGFDVAFESTMSEQQHKTFNDFLNGIVAKSHMPATPPPEGVPAKRKTVIDYKHTKAVDTFYELPKEEMLSLPYPVQEVLREQPGHKLRLRVTREQKTKAVIAKIIKARIADLHVFSPLTAFDWRVSVSLEMDWDGDLERLLGAEGVKGQVSGHDRTKDRVSYTQKAFQVDLTKVTSSQMEKGRKSADTHELEVEVSSDTIRHLGKLAAVGADDKNYERLVQAFADNVRMLTRLHEL